MGELTVERELRHYGGEQFQITEISDGRWRAEVFGEQLAVDGDVAEALLTVLSAYGQRVDEACEVYPTLRERGCPFGPPA